MSRNNQMINDLIEIFDEEYGKRNLITPQNTAEKLTAKGYRKTSDIAREIFEEVDSKKLFVRDRVGNMRAVVLFEDIAELEKKHTEVVGE